MKNNILASGTIIQDGVESTFYIDAFSLDHEIFKLKGPIALLSENDVNKLVAYSLRKAMDAQMAFNDFSNSTKVDYPALHQVITNLLSTGMTKEQLENISRVLDPRLDQTVQQLNEAAISFKTESASHTK